MAPGDAKWGRVVHGANRVAQLSIVAQSGTDRRSEVRGDAAYGGTQVDRGSGRC